MSYFRSVIIVVVMSAIVCADGPRSRHFRGSHNQGYPGEEVTAQLHGSANNKGLFSRNGRRRFHGNVDNVKHVDNVENVMTSRPRGFIKMDDERDESIMTKIHKHVHNHKAQKHQRKQQRKQFIESLKPVTEEQTEQVIQENWQGVQPPQVNRN